MTSSKNSISLPSLLLKPSIDGLLLLTLRGTAVITGVISGLIFFHLVGASLPAFDEVGVLRFVTDHSWNPTEKLFGLSPMLAGSLVVMAGAILIASPLGLISAVFCHLYAPKRLLPAYRRTMEVLAGIPSVVYGFWGLVVLVPLINEWHPPGASVFAAMLVLAIMVLPTMALMADAAFANVPRSYVLSAEALGLSRRGILRLAYLPAAKSGLFTGLILATGRAIGETMAVLMVCGNIVQVPDSIFDPVRTLTANIALEMAYATGTHRSALFVSGLLLLVAVVLLVFAAEAVERRSTHAS